MPGWIGSMASGITGGIGGMVSNIVGAVVGAVRNSLIAALRTVLGVASSVVLAAFQALAVGMVAITAVVGTLTATVAKATGALTAMARSINDLRGATGLDAGRAGGLINRYNAFGIRPEQTAAMFENSNPIMMSLRARMMGGRDIGDIPGMAQRFQSLSANGPMGNRVARSLLGDLDTAEFRRVLMQPIALLKQQEAFQSKTQAGLGVNPGMIALIGQQWEALTNKMRVFSDTVLIRLASEILPYVTQKFEQLMTYVSSNMPNIVKAITTGVDMFIRGAENIFNFFSKNGPAIAAAAQTAFSWIVNDLPPLLMRGGAVMLNVFAGMLEGIGNFATGMVQHLPIILSTLDIVLNGLRAFAANAVGIVAGLLGKAGIGGGASTPAAGRAPRAPGLGDALKGVDWNALDSPYERVPGVVTNNFLPLGRLLQALPKVFRVARTVAKIAPLAAVGGATYYGGRAVNDFNQNGGIGGWINGIMGPEGQAARDRFYADTSEFNTASKQPEIEAMMRILAEYAKGSAGNLRGRAGALNQEASDWQKTLAGMMAPSKERQSIEADLKQLVVYAKQTAQNTGATADNMLGFGERMAARVTSYMVQDAAMDNLRT